MVNDDRNQNYYLGETDGYFHSIACWGACRLELWTGGLVLAMHNEKWIFLSLGRYMQKAVQR